MTSDVILGSAAKRSFEHCTTGSKYAIDDKSSVFSPSRSDVAESRDALPNALNFDISNLTRIVWKTSISKKSGILSVATILEWIVERTK